MYDASEVNVVSFVCLWSNMFLYTANMVIKEYQFFSRGILWSYALH